MPRLSLQFVSRVTAVLVISHDTVAMETRLTIYKVVRALPDGQRVSVGTFRNEKEARSIIESLSEYWPGDYRILQPSPQEHEAADESRSSFLGQ